MRGLGISPASARSAYAKISGEVCGSRIVVTPKARLAYHCEPSGSSSSRRGKPCACTSTIPGMITFPDTSMTVAPGGMRTRPCGPTPTIRWPVTTMSACSITSFPRMVIARAPRSTTLPFPVARGTSTGSRSVVPPSRCNVAPTIQPNDAPSASQTNPVGAARLTSTPPASVGTAVDSASGSASRSSRSPVSNATERPSGLRRASIPCGAVPASDGGGYFATSRRDEPSSAMLASPVGVTSTTRVPSRVPSRVLSRIPSRAKCGCRAPPAGAISTASPPEAGTRTIAASGGTTPGAARAEPVEARTAMRPVPSGSQTGSIQYAADSESRTGAPPEARAFHRCPPSVPQVTKASHWPSGDHAGINSRGCAVLVRRVGAPSGAAMKIRPTVENANRPSAASAGCCR